MSVSLTLYGATPEDVLEDVYFRLDFAQLHADGKSVDSLFRNDFKHLAMIQDIPGTDYEDLETPWGYGGPVAVDREALESGIQSWHESQSSSARVAEFIRFHPFVNPDAYRGLVSNMKVDRLTVLVNLEQSPQERRRHYSKGTRYSIRKANEWLEYRRLASSEADLFLSLYDAGLERNKAAARYRLTRETFRGILEAEWADVWMAEKSGKPIAVACFLHAGPFVHYHLSGGIAGSRDTFAHYGLLERAIEHYERNDHSRWLHLGGGRSSESDDTLLAFKRRFSDWQIPFYVGGIVHDRETYNELAVAGDDRVLSYRFAQ